MSDYVKPVITGVPRINGLPNIGKKDNQIDKKNESFDKIFENQLKGTGIKISKHAAERIEQRKIDISQNVKEKVGQAIDMASKKGIKDSLILTEKVAFVVNVDSKTIVTAIDKDSLKEKVFTNIDGAVYL